MNTESERWRPLIGGTAVWVFMAVEVLTFGMFLVMHGASWSGQEAVYLEAQSHLHPTSATLGTVLLLIGSWTAYQGSLACDAHKLKAGAVWMALTAVFGLAFCGNKIMEYADLPGVTLSTNGFWFSYLFLTGLHLLHVLGGVVAFGWLAWRAFRGQTHEGEGLLHVHAGAAYWHLIDVIWLVLFPILYLMRP